MKWWLPTCTGMTLHQLRFAALLSSVLPDQISHQPQVKATQIARPPDPQSIHMLSAVCQQNSHWPFEAQVGNWKRKLSFATASWPFEERLPDDCKHIFLQDLFTSDFKHVMMTTMIIRAVRGTFSLQTSVLTLWKLRKRPHRIFLPQTIQASLFTPHLLSTSQIDKVTIYKII